MSIRFASGCSGIGASNQELFSQRGAGLVAQPYESVAKCLNAGGMGRQDYETESFVCHPIYDKTTRHNGATGRGSGNGLGVGKSSDPCPTLTAGDKHAVAVHGTQDPIVSINRAHALGRNNGGENAVVASFQQNASGESAEVRRLTPTECSRLQGFPDNHCRIPWRGKPAELCPDGPQYKAYGNSMAVPVMRWIGERIQKELLK